MKPLTYFKVKLWKNVPDEVCHKLLKRYVKNNNDYYRVVVFDNYEDMYKYGDKHFIDEKIEHNYSGICKYLSNVYYEDGKYIDVDRCCGWILLCKNQVGAGTVSHECSHAITFYYKYRITNCKKIFDDNEYNELFAYMLGSLVNQIYTKLYSKKII